MVPMIPQNHPLLASWFQTLGCAIDSVAAFRTIRLGKPWRVHELGAAVHGLVDSGIVSGDRNGDGDMVDDGEGMIQDWQKLADALSLPLAYLGKKTFKEGLSFTGDQFWVLQAWKWKIVHWTVKEPFFDPIAPFSLTCKNGAPYDLDASGAGGLRVYKVDLTRGRA